MDNERKWTDQGAVSELARSACSRRQIRGTDVLLCWVAGKPHALIDRCTHLDMSLEHGRVVGGRLMCPHHGACFDLATGRALSGPAVRPLRLIPAKIEDGRLYLDLAAIP